MSQEPQHPALKILLFLWVPVVVGAYFVVHKPWGDAPSLAMLWPPVDIILAGSLVTLAGGLGKLLVGVRLPALHRLERAAAEASLGLLVLSLAVLTLGLLGVLRPVVLWLLLIAGLIAVRRPARDWIAQLARFGGQTEVRGLVSWVACLLVGLVLAISLLKSLAPPTAWDSLVYHLELPKQYIAQGRVGFNPNNLFVGFPQLAEMIFTWAFGLRAGETAAVAGWMVGVLALLGTVGFGRRVLGEGAGWIPAAILVTGASLWQGLSWAYVDHWVLLFGAVAFFTLDCYSRSSERRYLVLAGLAAGAALATKYTGGTVAAGCGIFLLYHHLRRTGPAAAERDVGQLDSQAHPADRSEGEGGRPRRGALVGDLLILAGLTALVAAPWLARNTLQMGNPLYPFFLPGKEVDSLRQLYQAQHAPARGVLDALLLPWQATVLGIEGGPGFSTSIGPLLIALIPGALLGRHDLDPARRRSLARLAVLGAGLWLIWALGAHLVNPLARSRHYYGFLPPLAVLATAGYRSLRSLRIGAVRAGWILSRFLFFVFLLTAVSAVLYLGTISPIRVLTGQMSRQAYLEDQLGWYGRVMQELNALPAGSRVRFLWEPRAYYCQLDCLPDVILDQWWHSRRTVGPPEKLAAAWAQDGVTHVLIYDFGVELEKEAQPLLTEADWTALEQFRNQELTPVKSYGDGIYSLYALR